MDIEDYFDKDIKNSWRNCYEVWKDFGRVNDLPHGIRVTRYTPSLGKRLGYKFAEIYSFYVEELGFIVEKLSSTNKTERLCAFEILEEIAEEYYCESIPLPKKLLAINDPIPEPAYSEIRSERFFQEYKFNNIGEFLQIIQENE